MAIHLTTLGGLRVHGDDAELHRLLGQRLRTALLVYLAIEQRVSREHLVTLFWPESSGDNARHSLRQSLYYLNGELGSGWLETHAHELRVSPVVQTDAHAFEAALAKGEVEEAARLYAGPFLDGVNLLDLQPWESWVDGKRAGYARGFRRACRAWVDGRRTTGDVEGAIEAAAHWVGPDPFDDEAQHALIQGLAEAGERAEAIRQYDAYARLLESEGLRPLDTAIDLIERVRAEPAARPPPEHSDPPAPRPASSRESASAGRPAEQRHPPPQVVTVRRRPILPAVVLAALMLVVAALWGVRRSSDRPTAPPATAAVAVFPFAIHGAEGAEYLGEGMVNLLGTALAGAASVRPIDSRAVFGILGQQEGRVPDLETGRRLAERLHAELLVLGDIVQAGDRLQIEAAVYRAGGPSRPVARAAVSGDVRMAFDLVDQLAARLLSGLSDPSAGRLLRTAAVTTPSLPAFKAYLEGERLMRAGQFERAADALLQAVGHDSAFALAHYRLALTREWAPLAGIEQSAGDATRHAGRLSPRDRALLEAYRAWRAGEAAEAERLYRTILARYPDDVEAWIQLGEILFHYGPVLGHPVESSEDAWRRVLSYEPRNLYAIPHLARIAAVQERQGLLDSLLAPFDADRIRGDRRLLEAGLLRALASNDAVATRALVDEVRRWEDLATWRLAAWLAAFSADPAAARSVIRTLDEDHRSPAIRAELRWIVVALHLASGQVASAQRELARAVTEDGKLPADQQRWALEQVSEWYIATLPLPFADSTLARVRQRALAWSPVSPSARGGFENSVGLGGALQIEPLRLYTLGLLALRLNDAPAADTAAAALARLAGSTSADPLVRDLDLGLRARIAFHQGRAEQALALLASLENDASQGDLVALPFVSRANERLLRAEVLEALGRDVEALAWLESLGKGSVPELPFAAPAHLRQARIHARLGNRAEALRHYARLVELWEDADPQFRPLLRAARQGPTSMKDSKRP